MIVKHERALANKYQPYQGKVPLDDKLTSNDLNDRIRFLGSIFLSDRTNTRLPVMIGVYKDEANHGNHFIDINGFSQSIVIDAKSHRRILKGFIQSFDESLNKAYSINHAILKAEAIFCAIIGFHREVTIEDKFKQIPKIEVSMLERHAPFAIYTNYIMQLPQHELGQEFIDSMLIKLKSFNGCAEADMGYSRIAGALVRRSAMDYFSQVMDCIDSKPTYNETKSYMIESLIKQPNSDVLLEKAILILQNDHDEDDETIFSNILGYIDIANAYLKMDTAVSIEKATQVYGMISEYPKYEQLNILCTDMFKKIIKKIRSQLNINSDKKLELLTNLENQFPDQIGLVKSIKVKIIKASNNLSHLDGLISSVTLHDLSLNEMME